MRKTFAELGIWYDSLLFALVIPNWNWVIMWAVVLAYIIFKYLFCNLVMPKFGVLFFPIISSLVYSIICVIQRGTLGWVLLAIDVIIILLALEPPTMLEFMQGKGKK